MGPDPSLACFLLDAPRCAHRGPPNPTSSASNIGVSWVGRVGSVGRSERSGRAVTDSPPRVIVSTNPWPPILIGAVLPVGLAQFLYARDESSLRDF